MADQFITNTSGVFEMGQTVIAKVTNLDEEKQRFLVSLKVSELSLFEESRHARLLQGLKERKDISEMITCRGMGVGFDEQQMICCLTSVFWTLDYILVSLMKLSNSLSVSRGVWCPTTALCCITWRQNKDNSGWYQRGWLGHTELRSAQWSHCVGLKVPHRRWEPPFFLFFIITKLLCNYTDFKFYC